ncbi:hypothetical protein MNBD_BACTEROID04-1917 [hydrothermal vent metagenome]|uniref:Lipoprotein n=1 Tax=hydrothermal vent metagenome TaxID=652676 RepID=A0A3B0UHK3_9ZZZZ
MFKNFLLVFLVSFLVACGGGETTTESGNSSVDISSLNGNDGMSYASLIVPIVCEDGQNGFEYQTGPDDNPQNGRLDRAEVTSSAPACPPSAPLGWAQKLSYLEPSEEICEGDPRGGMLFEIWKDDGDGELDEDEVISSSVQWCNGKDGLTPIFNKEEFYNSEGQSCVRLSIGYDIVYENGILDMETDEVEISGTDCQHVHEEAPNTGLIFAHTFNYKVVVKASAPVAESSMTNPGISDVTFIRITGVFKRPRPDGLVTVHFLKSELQCLVGDQDPRHLGKDTYSVLCPAYGAYIPANEKIKVVWQVGPRRNLFELKKIEIFGYLPLI